MRIAVVRFMIVASICMPAPVLASQQSGTITLVATSNTTGPDGIIMSGTRTAKPACATDDVWAATSAKVFSVFLSAYLAGRSITVVGTGACNASQTNREDVGYVTIP